MVDFRQQLFKQLNYLNRSARLYDQGYHDEAIRIATSIRVLVHSKNKSTSLLKHLWQENIEINSTVQDDGEELPKDIVYIGGRMYIIANGIPTDPEKLREFNKNSRIKFDGSGSTYILPACYEDNFSEPPYKVPLKRWCKQWIIFRDENYTREDIYLGAANKDGGAHVDSIFGNNEYGRKYENIAYKGYFGVLAKEVQGEKIEVSSSISSAILRQMAHELLTTRKFFEIVNGVERV